MIMPPTKTQWFRHCTPLSPYPSPSFLLSSFNLLLSLPVVQFSPIMALPCFSNRRLEINSTLVWPETLAELNMNDWDCSYTCCWERCMMALAGMGVCFSLLPRVTIHAVYVLFFQLTGSLSYLVRDQCAALQRYCWGCPIVLGTEQWPVW